MSASLAVRHARTPADWRTIRELCCLTGRQGDPIETDRWPFFAELWVGPYERLRPTWSYVAETGGRVVGYLTGCPDSRRFRRERALRCTLPLLLRVAGRRFPGSIDASRFVRRTLGLLAEPERRLRRRGLPADVDDTHPAHLHMNVEAAARRRGVGEALLASYVRDLTTRGVPGVHLVCGSAPRPFYLRLGFRDLGEIEFRPGLFIYGLGRRLDA